MARSERSLKRKSSDLTTLQLSVRFYRAYPIRGIPHELTWEHYRNLLTVKDGKERKILEEKVIRSDNVAAFRSVLQGLSNSWHSARIDLGALPQSPYR